MKCILNSEHTVYNNINFTASADVWAAPQIYKDILGEEWSSTFHPMSVEFETKFWRECCKGNVNIIIQIPRDTKGGYS